MESWKLLQEVLLLLAGCLILGTLAAVLRQSPLVGYLLAGMLIGSFDLIEAQAHIEGIAELGVALLLLSLGLEFSWNRLQGLGWRVLAAGAAQVLVTGCAVTAAGFAALWIAERGGDAWGVHLRQAIALGAMLALSSTAAVLRVLVDEGDLDSERGRNALGVLLVQDMAVVPLAILMTLLSGPGEGDGLGSTLRGLGLAAVLAVALYLFLHYVAGRWLAITSLEKNRELSVLFAVVIGLGAAWAAHEVKLSPALGAFVAGMLLGASPFATQIRADVSGLRIALLTLFFGAVGLLAQPHWILANLLLVAGTTAAVLLGKAVLIWAILRAMGQSHRTALATGVTLCQVGEFAFVLGKIGADRGVVEENLSQLVMSVAIVSLFATPLLVRWAPWIAVAIDRFSPGDSGTSGDRERSSKPRVVIIGFGPAGQAVARELVALGEPVTALDLNAAAREPAAEIGVPCEIGDATHPEVLEHAGVDSAELVVITTPSPRAALTILQCVRNLSAEVRIILRTRHQRNHDEFTAAGAEAVIGDEEQAGLALAHYVREAVSPVQTPK